MNYREEKQECDAVVAMLLSTQPAILRAAIEARDSSRKMTARRQCLQDAIREAELLAAFLRDRQRRLGWSDDRSNAA